MAETAESPEVSHLKALYRDAHLRAENLGRRYQRMLIGAEAVLTTLDRESPAYVLLDAVIAASRWDGENASRPTVNGDA